MERLFNLVVNSCILVAWLSLFSYAVDLLFTFVSCVVKRKRFDFGKLDLRPLFKSRGGILFLIVLVVGFSYPFIFRCFASTEIGSFWEKGNYTEQYEATLYARNKIPVPCIATITKSTDTYDENDIRVYYEIERIDLPYEKYVYVYDEYDPDDPSPDVDCGDVDCEISLGKIATEQSFENLDKTILCPKGDYCASKKSDTYHKITCPYAKNIKPENILYFHDPLEAEIFGYCVCSDCYDW